MNEVDKIIEYHRRLKVAHHERMRQRLVRGEASGVDENAAFVDGVMLNFNLGNIGDDVGDLAAEASDEDSSDEETRPRHERKGSNLSSVQSRVASRRQNPLETPALVQIPKLVPIFKEMMRPSLLKARGAARNNQP